MKSFGILMVILSAVGIGIAPTFAKLALNGGCDTYTLVTLRNIIMLFLIVLVFLSTKTVPRISRAPLLLSVAMGPVYVVLAYGYLGSVAFISVSLAIMIYFLHPLFIAIVSRLIGRETVSATQIIATLCAFIGLGLSIGFSVGSIDMKGVFLAFSSAIACTIMILSNSISMKQSSSIIVIFYMVLSATILYGTVGAVTRNFHLPVTDLGWIGVLGVGLGYTIGILAFFWAVPILGAFRATMISTTEPLFGIFCAMIILGERISTFQVLGITLLLSSLLFVEIKAHQRTSSI